MPSFYYCRFLKSRMFGISHNTFSLVVQFFREVLIINLPFVKILYLGKYASYKPSNISKSDLSQGYHSCLLFLGWYFIQNFAVESR